MKVTIDVPEKEFGIDIANGFQDFFGKVACEIKERLMCNETLVCGSYEIETAEMFLKAFRNATVEKSNEVNHDE